VIVLRCTRKLLDRVGPPVADPPASTSRLGDWYAKPFSVAQRRYLLVISGPSRLPVLLPGRDAAGLAHRFAGALGDVLVLLGIPVDVVEREALASREVVIAATDSRSVLGSLNDFALLAQHRLRAEPEIDLAKLAVKLAGTPIIAGGFGFPYDVARRLLTWPSPPS